jgi:hypothetical protein
MALLCASAAILLRLQPIGTKPGLVNRFAGLMLNNGLRITSRLRLTGDRQLITATVAAWALWSMLGGAVIALLAPGYDPRRMYVIYGLLCGVGGAAVGFALGAIIGLAIVKATNMSSFEGKSGYFTATMALLGTLIGFLVAAITMTIFFYRRGH